MTTPEATSAKDYAILFVKQLRQLGDSRQWGYDATANSLVAKPVDEGGNKSLYRINLGNMYGEWLKLPSEARPEQIQRAAMGIMMNYVPSTLSEVRPHLLPIVRSTADRGQAIIQSSRDTPPLIHRPICDGFEMGLAYDNPHNIARLNASHLADWGITEDEAFSIALDNLRTRSSAPMKDVQLGLYVSTWEDYYDASRLLLPELMQKHISMGAPVVMAPTKYGLFLCSDRNEFGLALMVQLAERALSEPQAMCPTMLRWVDGRWTNFIPAAHAVKLNHLKTISLSGEYNTQKLQLDDRLKELNRDLFVAKYMAGKASDADPMTTACTWSKGVPSLLPRTDLICFVDPNGGKDDAVVVKTENALAIVGKLMAETTDEPPRFFVTAYPDAEQLAQLRRVAFSANR